jgi:hypothetical protein
MPDLYTTNVLMGVVADLKTPQSWLLDRYFGQQFTDPSEEIHFDVIPGKRRIAPFVSPLVEGQVVESRGFQTKTFKPAYIKPKVVHNANRAFKRTIGEKIGGSLSPEQRVRLNIAFDLEDLTNMATRRMEVMASEALRTAKVTVKGDKYPTTVVDFGRTAGNLIADLTSTARWGQSAAVPLRNLAAWGAIGLQNSGAYPVDVIMGTDAWNEFRDDPKVEKRLLAVNTFNQNLAQGAQQTEGGQYMGTIDNFNIYVYGGWYVDPDTGSETAIFPTKAVLMTSSLVEGVRAFGAIQDEDAGFQAVPFFPKSWKSDDPSVRYLMVQSAPLTVVSRPDATVYNNDVVG